VSQFRDLEDQFEQLKDITPDIFTLPSELPMPDATPAEQPSDPPPQQTLEMPSQQPSEVPTQQPFEVPSQQPSEMPPPTTSDLPPQQPSNLPPPLPSDLPPQQPSNLPGGGLPDFFDIDRQARQIRQQEQDPESLLEAIRELPDRIAEALRNG
tara:strand:+ start:731 stop:1189 length:459 start_codon:yes stop_codon:yes gene_type:complete